MTKALAIDETTSSITLSVPSYTAPGGIFYNPNKHIGLEFDNKNFSDVTLVSGKSNACPKARRTAAHLKIHAHRIILATNSAFFRKMFASGLQETASPEIKMGCSFAALEIIVRYIYTKHIPFEGVAVPSFELWSEIYQNACLMDMPDLAEIALWFCYTCVTPKNILDLLLICREHTCPGVILTDVCEFMKKHYAS